MTPRDATVSEAPRCRWCYRDAVSEPESLCERCTNEAKRHEWIDGLRPRISTKAQLILRNYNVGSFDELRALLARPQERWSSARVKNMGKVARRQLEMVLIRQGEDSSEVVRSAKKVEAARRRLETAERALAAAKDEHRAALAAQRAATRSKQP